MNAGLTLGSLFDGIAGFPLAAGRHGIKTVWTSEIEPNCIDIAKRHFPDAVNHPEFPTPVLRAGEEYRESTSWRFFVR